MGQTVSQRIDVLLSLTRASERLEQLDLYAKPVNINRVRVIVSKLWFRIPGIRRFDGFALSRRTILLRPGFEGDNDLMTHELTHCWQMINDGWRMPLSYFQHDYDDNPYEEEANFAVWATR